ncbi:MAG TPA: acetate--CoA ligase [Thermoplasmata archaeon]|nr:acetate--CoA ligase [Thermoplasmata archaeon]
MARTASKLEKGEEASSLSEAEIAVHWKEEESYPPPAKFVAQANLTDPKVMDRFSLDRFPECFREFGELLAWDQKWTTTLDASNAPFYRWYVGGKLNASYNCIDRHLDEYRNKAAIIFVGEPEDEAPVAITYQDLYVRVNEMAALLRDEFGLKAGDRVTIHLPMTPELPITMLACARLGVVHTVVFGGFSGESAGRRAADSGSRVFVTIDGYYRSGKFLDHRPAADLAVTTASAEGQTVEKVLIWQRHPGKYQSAAKLVEGRDYIVNDLLKKYRGARVDPVSMPAEAPLFLMYTSGTTGRPKGCQHAVGGYLAYVTATAKWIQDIHPHDVYWCTADIGWITGHSYIVYGPLALGGTSVLYEGVPTFPDAGRMWRIAERLGVNIFHTAPTAIRQLRRLGPDEPKKYKLRFKTMTTVGEPIEPETWLWFYHTVGHGQAAITDTWWQTETGGVLLSTKPGIDRMKPGSAGPPVPGIHPMVMDENGQEIPPGSNRAGNICIRNPWPGLMTTIWGDPERYKKTYFQKYNKHPASKDWRDWPYFAGDGAVQAADGYYRILGRVDDVINVAGHRLGTKEIESACLTVAEVAEAAVVPIADDVKGRVPEVFVTLRPGATASPELERKIVHAIESEIGKIARPSAVRFVPDMPKTRSGKIMRRVLAAISNTMDVGDTTTLANPDIVEQIRVQVQGKAKVAAKAGPADIKEFGGKE